MDLLPPIVKREFCRAYLGTDLYRSKWIVGAVFAVLLILDALLGNQLVQGFRSVLLAVPIYQAVIDGLRIGSLLLKDEFGEGELEVLLTTPLSSIEILAGKVIGQTLRGMQFVWLEIPFFSFAVIFEVLTPSQGLISALYCLVLFSFCILLGVAVSLRLRFSMNAWLIAWLVFLGLAAPPLALDYWRLQLAPLPGFPTELLYLSPLNPTVAILKGFPSGSELDALRTIGLLAISGIALSYWVWIRFRGICHGIGVSDERQPLRPNIWGFLREDPDDILDRNPFVHLALKDPSATRVALWFLVTLVVIVGGASCIWGSGWISPMNSLLAGCVLFGTLSTLVHYDLCHRIAKERRQGTLELLLTSLVSPEDIMKGQIEATRHRFRRILLLSLGVDVGLCGLSIPNHSWNLYGCLVYGQLWLFLVYWTVRAQRPRHVPAGFRTGLLTGNPFHSFTAGLRKQPWYYYILMGPGGTFAIFGRAGAFPSGTLGEMVLVTFLVFAMAAIAAASTQAQPTILPEWVHDFRKVTSTPIPSPEDVRIREWNGLGDWPPVPGLRENA